MTLLQALRETLDRITGRAYKSNYNPNKPISFKELFETMLSFIITGALIYFAYQYFVSK